MNEFHLIKRKVPKNKKLINQITLVSKPLNFMN